MIVIVIVIVAMMGKMSVIVHTQIQALLRGNTFQDTGFHTTIGPDGPLLFQRPS